MRPAIARLFAPVARIRDLLMKGLLRRRFGLKAKITSLIIVNVVGVLLLANYLDFRLSEKDQIDLYLNRNLYIAKQIDAGIPNNRMMEKLPQILEEIEEWLFSRPSLMAIDVVLFNGKGWDDVASLAKWSTPHRFTLSPEDIQRVKKDRHVFALRKEEDEKWLEVIVPIHSGRRVIGGIRVASSWDEPQNYLDRKRNRVYILTISSIVVLLLAFTLFFGRLVGSPIDRLVEAMTRAEAGDLETEAPVRSRDELSELSRHFNRMLRTIRETHQQNLHLLHQVSQFNAELTRKVDEATFELAKRNEELRLLNEALFESQRQVSQSEKLAALGQVTATMAHQIGTPLNSISGYIQLMLQEGTLSPRDRERLKIVESQLDRLADSVKKMLSFTRLPRPPLKPLGVNGVLEELVRLGDPWFHSRKIALVASLAAGLPPVLGDTTHLQTLFFNLVSNALDAMPQGGTLTVLSRMAIAAPDRENGDWVEISIADSGIGITEESKKRIFDPFFTTKKIGEGTGLGLAICGKIVQEHGGKLKVESEVGRGSTFSVFIPAFKEGGTDGT